MPTLFIPLKTIIYNILGEFYTLKICGKILVKISFAKSDLTSFTLCFILRTFVDFCDFLLLEAYPLQIKERRLEGNVVSLEYVACVAGEPDVVEC